MKSISYKSPELMGKLEMLDNIFGALTVKTDLLAGTLPLNNEGLFVSHFFRGFNKETRPEELLKKLFDNEDIPCNIVFSNDWKGHFAIAETMQKDRVFLAGTLVSIELGTCLFYLLVVIRGSPYLPTYLPTYLPVSTVRKLLLLTG